MTNRKPDDEHIQNGDWVTRRWGPLAGEGGRIVDSTLYKALVWWKKNRKKSKVVKRYLKKLPNPPL